MSITSTATSAKGTHAMNNLADLTTPYLLLDPEKMRANCERLQKHMDKLGVPLRPHVKTAKSVDIVRRMIPAGRGPITVSTLKEAEYFAEHGFTDMTYAVGISPDKLPRVARLNRAEVTLRVLLDSKAQAEAVVAFAKMERLSIPALIEIDCDGERAGLQPGDDKIVEIGRILHENNQLAGILMHAGGSYHCPDKAAKQAAAEHERMTAVAVKQQLLDAGLPCEIVSVGSTPTAHFAKDLTGITEMRAGVYVFHDLVMAGIHVCSTDDIAISVVATVIGHRPDKGWIMTDAGWMALSRDRGTAKQEVDQGYGLVCAMDGTPYPDLIVANTSQEHGVLALRKGSKAKLPELRVGSKVRILPNHACATASQFQGYVVPDGDELVFWPRINGW
ncbi:DSD1 family PLP-dependent enzyme [Pseudidiomarina terrestris]|uniref:DSD1 family PLP-dependent enzyme n=1 Tax=Pseudidiomarina terrestris TaxID=2820060 RepID=UPI00265B1A7E|nr:MULTISPECIES: DSD1 family PLP-dependent enzyme [unclassified Pseudidiomarina]